MEFMTINDLKKVYHGKVYVTANAYFKNGEYYSFRTVYSDLTIDKVDERTSSLEILRMFANGGELWIDVKEFV